MKFTATPVHLVAALLLCLAALAQADAAPPCRRIVSLAPNVTEILFALDLGDQVVGVTRYCKYPPEAAKKTVVGGFLDPSLESVLRLQPDIIFVVKSLAGDRAQDFRKLDLQVEELDDHSVSSILDSITKVGKVCGRVNEAKALRARLEDQVAAIQQQVASKPTVSAVILVGEGGDEDSLRNLFLSGRDGFYSELLKIAGGRNVYEGLTAGMPAVSAEGLMTMNPDVIIHIHPNLSDGVPPPVNRSVLKRKLPELRAVRKDRLSIIQADYAVVPGPRFVELLKDFERILHGK